MFNLPLAKVGNDHYIAPDYFDIKATLIPSTARAELLKDATRKSGLWEKYLKLLLGETSSTDPSLLAQFHQWKLMQGFPMTAVSTFWVAHCEDDPRLLNRYPALFLHRIRVVSPTDQGAVEGLARVIRERLQRAVNIPPGIVSVER